MCLQSRNTLALSPATAAKLQRIVQSQRSSPNGKNVTKLREETTMNAFQDIRASCIHCMKGPYMIFSQNPQTYATAINILDAFMWRVKVTADLVSIVGVACFVIAAKLTEDDENIPGMVDLTLSSGHSWTTKDLCRMETVISSKLEWEFPTTTYMSFLPIFAQAWGVDPAQTVSDRLILYAERCLRRRSTILMPAAGLALALVHHIRGILTSSCLVPLSELITTCEIEIDELMDCIRTVGKAASSTFTPPPLPSFCPRVRHGRKHFAKPSKRATRKLSTIPEMA